MVMRLGLSAEEQIEDVLNRVLELGGRKDGENYMRRSFM
jgi:hypothetical protein